MSESQAAEPLQTRLVELLGIRYPIVLAGMAGGPTTPALVAAVSNAGGLGILGAGRMSLDQLRDAIGAIRSLTDRPFGVNLLLAGPEEGNADVAEVQHFLDRFRAELGLPPGGDDVSVAPADLDAAAELIISERVPVLSVGLGDPSRWVEAAHAAGTHVMAMVSTVAEAVQVVDGGVDVVVAQGAEAGGHRSSFAVGADGEVPLVGTLALVPQVVDAVPVPVVAAGGVMDGRGVAAALALGAAGALLGTRFLLARESGTHPAHQERLLTATEVDTVVTRALSGRPARSIRNRLTEAFAEGGPEPLAYGVQTAAAGDIYQAARRHGEYELFPLWAGQGVRLSKRGQGGAEIVEELVRETSRVLARLGRLAG